MKINKIIQRTIRHAKDGLNLAADVNAAVAADVNEAKGQHTHVSSHQRIVQRDGETVVSDQRTETGEGGRSDGQKA